MVVVPIGIDSVSVVPNTVVLLISETVVETAFVCVTVLPVEETTTVLVS